jgi:hypothetical protein
MEDKSMNSAKTCLAILVGVIVGATFTSLAHTQPVKARDKSVVWVQRVGVDSNILQHGTVESIIGFSCITKDGNSHECFILSK